jgi:hypothetical protein
MRTQVEDVMVTKEQARDRIAPCELKLLPFRQGGIDTPDQLLDRHRHFCAWCWCIRHARFITASARLPAIPEQLRPPCLRQEDKITNFSRARKQHVDQKSTLCQSLTRLQRAKCAPLAWMGSTEEHGNASDKVPAVFLWPAVVGP